MSFLNNLAKGFVRSAVNQVGRDGGKVISNKVYKGGHSTPIHTTDSINNESSYIDSSIQPKIKSGGASVVIKGILIQIIPGGLFAVIYQSIKYLTRKSTDIYITVPNKVIDRRYTVGYRIEGYSIVKSGQTRMLSQEELYASKSRGKSYLLSLVILIGILFLMYIAKIT